MSSASRLSDGEQSFFENVESVLLRAESAAALVESLTPRNFESEAARLVDACELKTPELPRFVYSPRQSLVGRATSSRRDLDEARHLLGAFSGRHPLVELLEQRIQELSLEAELVDRCGSASAHLVAARRYCFTEDELLEARSLAEAWMSAPAEPLENESAPKASLASLLNERARQEEDTLGTSVVVRERDLASIAAVGGDCLYVRRGAQATTTEARRIWVHEVQGHLLPRLRARKNGAPFRIGTRGCSEDEEGRAILLEERASCLDGSRRLELAVRFLLGQSTLEAGPEGGLTAAREALARGIPPRLVSRTLARVLRGGGLGREVIYLPAYVRVKRSFAVRPGLEAWLEAGRISISGALTFSDADWNVL